VLRVVLDANVYVSALIRPQGPPGQVIMRFLENSFEIVLSAAIVEETVRAFAYEPTIAASAAKWMSNVRITPSLIAWHATSVMTRIQST
jgi:putative PIN family toxin of toxin-antitoxin system